MAKKKSASPITIPLDIDPPGGVVVNDAPATLNIDGSTVEFQPGELAEATPPPTAESTPAETVCINRKCRSTEVSEIRPTGQRQVIGGKAMKCVIKVCAKCKQRRGEWIPAEETNGGR